MKRLSIFLIGAAFLSAACGSGAALSTAGQARPQQSPSRSTIAPTAKPAKPAAALVIHKTDGLPAIVVDGPKPGDRVSSAVHIFGTADVFEGVLTARILDADGTQIASTHTDATCGSGCRGDYSVWIAYSVPSEQKGSVEIYEASAKDGSALHKVKVPVTLTGSGPDCGCGDLEKPIWIVTPHDGDTISNPVFIRGHADVFEAALILRILDEDGKVLVEVPVQASCGTGCVGDFSATIAYHVDHEQPGKIWAFDYSAKDGSIENLEVVSVTLTA